MTYHRDTTGTSDAAFANMAHDHDYLAEAERISQECAYADWEALRMGEREEDAREDQA